MWIRLKLDLISRVGKLDRGIRFLVLSVELTFDFSEAEGLEYLDWVRSLGDATDDSGVEKSGPIV